MIAQYRQLEASQAEFRMTMKRLLKSTSVTSDECPDLLPSDEISRSQEIVTSLNGEIGAVQSSTSASDFNDFQSHVNKQDRKQGTTKSLETVSESAKTISDSIAVSEEALDLLESNESSAIGLPEARAREALAMSRFSEWTASVPVLTEHSTRLPDASLDLSTTSHQLMTTYLDTMEMEFVDPENPIQQAQKSLEMSIWNGILRT